MKVICRNKVEVENIILIEDSRRSNRSKPRFLSFPHYHPQKHERAGESKRRQQTISSNSDRDASVCVAPAESTRTAVRRRDNNAPTFRRLGGTFLVGVHGAKKKKGKIKLQGCVRYGTYRDIPRVLPVPDSSVSSVRHQYRYRTVR